MKDQLKQFITAEIMRDPDYDLHDDEELISGGLIDSFSLVQVQLYIQEQFGVQIPDPDMTVETANTVDQILDLIEQSR